MTTTFKPVEPLSFSQIFDGRLQRFGVYPRLSQRTTETNRALTDGWNSIWIEGDPNGSVSKIIVWGTNNPKRILSALSETFGAKIVALPEDEELQKARIAQEEDELIAEISRRFHRQLSGIEAGLRMPKPGDDLDHNSRHNSRLVQIWIGVELVREDSTLVQPEKRNELFSRIWAIFEIMLSTFKGVERIRNECRYNGDLIQRRKIVDEDFEEGPVHDALMFQIANDGVLVAVDRPDISERRARSAELAWEAL